MSANARGLPDFRSLPVYQERERLVAALAGHQVVVVESPTGSGKTTQLPVILHAAGYSDRGVIGVTQPRRIAAVSVSDVIGRQLAHHEPAFVAYKMRFDDRTGPATRIKVMTDGILLQEVKHDRSLSAYSVVIVDEAHERSLNIDFALGLLKRALAERPDLRVMVSSATINAEVFSAYFDTAPIVRIDTRLHPVQVIYAPTGPIPGDDRAAAGRFEQRRAREAAYDALLDRIVAIIRDMVREQTVDGDFLVFLPGEQAIKDCIQRLSQLPERKLLHILPLYGRLSREDQEAVFPPAPAGTFKVVVATNIAETSITIDGITTVIDSGLAKTNHYHPRSYTSALIEGPIARASADQRKGRAGRTRPGRVYRLYPRESYATRPLFATEEIYRTDLSEVLLRMAELGIRDFEGFDFIASPGVGNIAAAVQTLVTLGALDELRILTPVGHQMAHFPLLPRHSRAIVEAILRFPAALGDVLVVVAFLTSATPFVLPPGEEVAARQAHHMYRDPGGDFVSYLRLFAAYRQARDTARFCRARYLDPRTMAEIANVADQLELILSEFGVPVGRGGSTEQVLLSLARGLIQFVCMHVGKGVYRSLTAERIQIHPGSGLFRESPEYLVAGEIVKTSRVYARSVSPLKVRWLHTLAPDLVRDLKAGARRSREAKHRPPESKPRDHTRQVLINGSAFPVEPYKGKKKIATLEWRALERVYASGKPRVDPNAARMRARIVLDGSLLMNGDRLADVLRTFDLIRATPKIHDLAGVPSYTLPTDSERLDADLELLLSLCKLKASTNTVGFVTLYGSDGGRYWMKGNRSFGAAAIESLASLEQLIDAAVDATTRFSDAVGTTYRRVRAAIDD